MRHAENLAGMPEFTGQEKHAISIYPINGIQNQNPTISDLSLSHGVIHSVNFTPLKSTSSYNYSLI